MSQLAELRTLRFEITRLGYELGALNERIKAEPKRPDLKRIRASKLLQLKGMNDHHATLLPKIKSSPFSRADLVDVINKLADIESQIVHGGTEQGHGAIRGYIDWLMADAERLEELGAA